jgi:hypothetical protein
LISGALLLDGVDLDVLRITLNGAGRVWVLSSWHDDSLLITQAHVFIQVEDTILEKFGLQSRITSDSGEESNRPG